MNEEIKKGEMVMVLMVVLFLKKMNLHIARELTKS